MPDLQIYNPGGAFGLTGTPPVTFVQMVNGSSGTLLPGDVVVFNADTSGVIASTTTTAADVTVLGVVGARIPTDSLNTQSTSNPYPTGAVMPVIVQGPARINVGANTVAAGAVLGTAAVAKTAITEATPAVATAIAVALEAAKDANNTVRAYINKM